MAADLRRAEDALQDADTALEIAWNELESERERAMDELTDIRERANLLIHRLDKLESGMSRVQIKVVQRHLLRLKESLAGCRLGAGVSLQKVVGNAVDGGERGEE